MKPTNLAKHKIFKWSSRWLFQCGHCPALHDAHAHHAAVYAGERHVLDDHPSLVTIWLTERGKRL